MWIPIDKSLPPVVLEVVLDDWARSESVLVVFGGGEITIAYREWSEEFGAEWYQAGRDRYSCPGVTHWMPLPEVP